MIFIKNFIVQFLFACLVSCISNASPNSITFQSRIIKPDGLPLESASVSFRVSITDTVGSCVLYQEDFSNRNMSGNKGLVNLAIGTGSKVFPVAAMSLAEVFNNYNSPNINCLGGGSIVVGSTDRRKLILQFNDGSGWQTVPAMDINSNPFALQAISAHKLGDFPASDYVRTAIFPTCGVGQALHFDGASFTCVTSGGGSGTVTSVSSANADIAVSMSSPTPVLSLNSGTGINQIVKLDGTAALPSVSGANLTNLNATNLSSGTVAAARMPALTGDVTTLAGSTTTAISSLARSKIANGTINHVVINDGTGVLSSEASLAVSRGGTGAGSFAANQIVGINGTGTALTSFTCGLNQIIKFDITGNATCATDLGTGAFVDGGNTFSATATLGTNSNHNLEIETNGTTKMTILANGNVGIGTSTPAGILDVQGGTASSGNGTTINIIGQNGAPGISSGGSINISGGTSAGNTGGSLGGTVVISGGGNSHYGAMPGAKITVGGAIGSGPTAGVLTLEGGNALNGATGGNVVIRGGTSNFGSGGDVVIDGAPLTGIGNHGNVLLGSSQGNVGIGTTTPGQKLEVSGGVRLNTATAKPSCDATTRGTFWVNQGSAGIKDSVEVCAKDAADSYAWRTLY